MAREEWSPLGKQLRWKFVQWGALAVALVLTAILAVIDIANYVQTCNQADQRVSFVVQTLESGSDLSTSFSVQPPDDGSMPTGPGEADDGAETGESTDADEDSDGDSSDSDGAAADAGSTTSGSAATAPQTTLPRMEEARFETRWFYVVVDGDGEVGEVDVTQVAAVDEDDAVELAEDVLDSGSTTGFMDDYRFAVADEDDGSKFVVFVDSARELSSFRTFVVTTVVGGLAGLAGVIALLILVSPRVVEPVVSSQRRQRRFVTDASHELKTPLAIISSATEVIEIESGESEWTQSIHNQVDRLTDLTGKLVALSKADEGPEALNKSEFNLSAVAESVIMDMRPVARASNRELESDVNDAVTLVGDQNLVRQVISLLLDNALKYSDEGGRVIVRVVARRSGHAEIRVWNSVESIEPGDHSEFFDRFYRADESRSQSGGHGVGLAVVRAVVEAHGGTVRAISSDGRSVEFLVRL